ncbi:MAG: NUDIX domain-containing protein, partial [Streptosporangiaceae bacterium]
VQIGPPGASASHASDPTVLSDVFARIGGATVGKATQTLQVNSNNVVGDDLWLWRADHGNSGTVGWTTNTAANGLVVNGADVTMYGLAVEHYQAVQVQWNGNGGADYFYQSEMPYDPPSQSAWMDGSSDGYPSIAVASSVTSFEAYGLGVYCFFDVNPSEVSASALTSPTSSGVQWHDMVTVSLGGTGTIEHIIDGTGAAVDSGKTEPGRPAGPGRIGAEPMRPGRRHVLLGGMISAPYAGLSLDRLPERREDPGLVAALAADPKARVVPLWRDQCLVAGDPPSPVVLPADAIDDAGQAQLVLLGLDNGTPYFAVDLSDLGPGEALERVGADAAADIRTVFAGLPAVRAAVLAYARGLLYWNRHQRFCGRCGSVAQSRHAGHLRACALLAGFVEMGESLEDAVRREILEEAGVRLRDVSYVGSQPWPFPAGLMVGFRATAADESVTVDGNEIIEARWFTRDQLRDYASATDRLGRPDSIDRIMLTAWLAQDGDDEIGAR